MLEEELFCSSELQRPYSNLLVTLVIRILIQRLRRHPSSQSLGLLMCSANAYLLEELTVTLE